MEMAKNQNCQPIKKIELQTWTQTKQKAAILIHLVQDKKAQPKKVQRAEELETWH